MDHLEAYELIRDGVKGREESTWADLGAGRGTFTRALAGLLGPESTVYAVDKSRQAVQALRRLGAEEGAAIRPLQGDFSETLELPKLDGILMANALHFVEGDLQARALRRIARYLHPDGRLLVVEYDRVRANRWVPFPVPVERLRTLAEEAGLPTPHEIGRRRSSYGREMYAALLVEPGLFVTAGS